MLAAYDIQKLFRSSDLDIRVVNVVHDAIIVECPIDTLQEWIPKILRTMERPPSVAQLGIDLDLVPMSADAEIGKNYKTMAKWDDTSPMLIRICDWLKAGAPKDRVPKTEYK